MSPPRDPLQDPMPDPALERALGTLPPVQADPAFEARLRARFLSGEPAGEEPKSIRPAPRRASPLRLVGSLVTLAAAALAVFLLITRGGEREAWTLLAGAPGAEVYVDDRATPADDAAAIAKALAEGASVRTPDDVALSLRLGEHLAVHVGPASEVRLPGAAHDGAWQLGAEAGHLSIVTGPGFQGPLTVRSPVLEVAVTGTRFAVDVYDTGTCVCCTEGTLEVRSLEQPEQGPVQGGAMAFGMPDGSLKFADMVIDEHVEPLEALCEAWR